ncbi:MAG: tetratricopeptide repeat protein [Moritella sp.]|uniref:SirB1 family protein n=1 Tax=Moritella sp. TaxID=78556 RepID=UPI001E000B8A|nr:tetratricopeptide repeat protein [Moritella sp.]NQZ50824.1 tetratricopeptide repeat protein [Moritella sp.]
MELDANATLTETELAEDVAIDNNAIDRDSEQLEEYDDELAEEVLMIDNVMLATLSAIEVITEKPLLEQAIVELDELIELIDVDMQGFTCDVEKRDQLLYLFYQQLGFAGDWRKWLELDSVLLHKVISSRNGVPLSLGTVFMYFAEHFEVDVTGIIFPGQFVLRFGSEQDGIYVDPADGQALSRHKLQVLLRGIEGNHALLSDDDLLAANNEMHYLRLLQVLKAALIRDEHFSYALRCIDLILELEPDEPYEIRDRGFLLQQLDCKKLASEDFAYFIEQCPDDPISRVLKAQIDELAATDDTIH